MSPTDTTRTEFPKPPPDWPGTEPAIRKFGEDAWDAGWSHGWDRGIVTGAIATSVVWTVLTVAAMWWMR